MKKALGWFPLFLLLQLLAWPLSAQDDLLKRLFDKEAPVFNLQVAPTADSGTVMMMVYFTHSKVSALEISVWIKDQGTQLSGEGESRLVKSLHEIGNRQQDTFLVKGFAHRHFYTIGLDYRAAKSNAAKFTSKTLNDSYLYEYAGKTSATRRIRDNAAIDTPREEKPAVAPPCENADVNIRLAPYGYCGDDDYPAVLIDCINCQGKNWEFSVEYKAETGQWKSLRDDGKLQTAFGNATRTEPLCALHPGVYKIRVATRGKNCSAPTVYYADGSVVVADGGRQSQAMGYEDKKPSQDLTTKNAPVLPDTCEVQANAIVSGNAIRGTLALLPSSPCADMTPYAQLTYVHPGYRDITLQPILLTPGVPSSFEVKLDERDLERNIHTLQVVAYINGPEKGIPISSFWVKAREQQLTARTGDVKQPDNKPVQESKKAEEEKPAKAADPATCNQIDDFRLVYLPGETEKPFYLSWLNPGCCQQTGCQFMVWGGKLPGQLRLLAEGNKRGAMIKEVLQGVTPADDYFEVILKLANGEERRAAYILGKGPIYGSDAIAQYQRQVKGSAEQQPKGLPESSKTNEKKPEVTSPKAFEYATPSKPLDSFSPCKYRREISLVAEQPVVDGDEITINYQFTEPGYEYTLYLQPTGISNWVLAPGTTEGQGKPSFTFEATPFHSGKYLMLIYKADKNWGCLSANPEEALQLTVTE